MIGVLVAAQAAIPPCLTASHLVALCGGDITPRDALEVSRQLRAWARHLAQTQLAREAARRPLTVASRLYRAATNLPHLPRR